jgi:hypothetical protein
MRAKLRITRPVPLNNLQPFQGGGKPPTEKEDLFPQYQYRPTPLYEDAKNDPKSGFNRVGTMTRDEYTRLLDRENEVPDSEGFTGPQYVPDLRRSVGSDADWENIINTFKQYPTVKALEYGKFSQPNMPAVNAVTGMWSGADMPPSLDSKFPQPVKPATMSVNPLELRAPEQEPQGRKVNAWNYNRGRKMNFIERTSRDMFDNDFKPLGFFKDGGKIKIKKSRTGKLAMKAGCGSKMK